MFYSYGVVKREIYNFYKHPTEKYNVFNIMVSFESTDYFGNLHHSDKLQFPSPVYLFGGFLCAHKSKESNYCKVDIFEFHVWQNEPGCLAVL